MSTSFWWLLAICVLSFGPVLLDHGQKWREFKDSTGLQLWLKGGQVLFLWLLPFLTLCGTVISGFESSETDNRLQEANREIQRLQPKPLKERVRIFVTSLHPEFIERVKKSGQREFVFTMTYQQIAELQRLTEEDLKSQYIRQIVSTSLLLNGPAGTQGGIRFAITDALLQ